MDGLLDEWMTGFELKGKQRMLSYTQIIEKAFRIFFTGLFYSYVSDTQPSSTSRRSFFTKAGNPFIQSSMGR
jgi:hypothetical protein